MTHLKPFAISLLLIALVMSLPSKAQDAHYWTEQYGNKSMLLSGTVNASVEDLGLVFYNPGRLAQIENPAFVISAKVYELINTRITDGLGEGKDLTKSTFGGAPSLVAGTFKLPFLKNHHFAFSFLTRFRYNTDFSTRSETSGEQLIMDKTFKQLSAKIKSNNSLNEDWFGLTWSHSINKKISVGLSTFAYQRNNSRALELQLQGLQENNQVSILNYNRQLRYEAYGFLWKAGLAAQLNKINLGLTITTPKINLVSKGSTIYEDFQSGIDSLNNQPTGDIYVENYQDNLPINHRSSWAIGAGISFKLSKSVIHINSEWYNQIKKYTVLETDPFIGQYPMDTISLRMVDELKSAINFGIGYEHYFSDKLGAYASFATDFTAVNSKAGYLFEFEDEIAHSRFDGDVFHLGGGITLNYPWGEITIGTTYAFSERTIPRPLNLGDDQIIGSEKTSTFSYDRWRFILGFSFPFASKYSDKFDLIE